MTRTKTSWLDLRGLMRPVPSARVPRLQGHIDLGSRFGTMVVLALSPLTLPVALWSPKVYPERVAMVGLLFAASSALWLAILRWRTPRRTGLGHSLYISFVAFLSCSLWWCRLDAMDPLPNGALLLLPMTALLCPMELRWWLPLCALVNAAQAWAAVSSGAVPEQLRWTVMLGFSTSLCTVVGVQMMRHLWLRHEEAQRQIMAANRLSTLGRHTAGIAHELKTPLAAALNGAYGLEHLLEELRESLGHPEVGEEDLRAIEAEMQEQLASLKTGLVRSSGFVTALRGHTQQMHRQERAVFDVHERLDKVARLLRHTHRRLRLSLPEEGLGLHVHGDPHKFDQVLINLISNATEASLEAGLKEAEVELQLGQEGGQVLLAVTDQGPGVPEELQERIFEPLFTTRGEGEGTGLGLAICRDIVEGLLGGTLVLAPAAHRRGARFELRVPLCKEQERPARRAGLQAAEPAPEDGYSPYLSSRELGARPSSSRKVN